ncbi:hypothetical protein NQ317_001799 [Molorchus minor]|uniref:DUF5641 domain-containing protein n=1 Tax=Molorchus minor TaxID=1323400 RepID=A0ABQ9IRI8_9CUCU|nr:hypothetical protein NQ317_001799 [Molorchus minor]
MLYINHAPPALLLESAKTDSSYSLNDLLYTGPKLQKDVVTMFLNFRLFAVAFIADLRQMYRQILLEKKRLAFSTYIMAEVSTFELNTVSFGVKSSPFLALRTVCQLANDEQFSLPLAAEIVKKDMYTDDLISSVSTGCQAIILYRELVELFRRGGFELVKWATNSKLLLQNIPEEYRSPSIVHFDTDFLKVLGLQWDPHADILAFSLDISKKKCSKRIVLSTVARCFDPLGSIFMFSSEYLCSLACRHVVVAKMAKITRETKSDIVQIVNECLSDDFTNKLCSRVFKQMDKRMEVWEGKFGKIDKCLASLSDDLSKQLANVDDSLKSIKSSLDSNNEKLTNLTKTCDQLQQNIKSNSLRFCGIEESDGENTVELIASFVTMQLKIPCAVQDIDFAYRIGKVQGNDSKKRAILVKFVNHWQRSLIFNAKKSLKSLGTRVAVYEDLTKDRYQALVAAKEKYGKQQAWSAGGKIFALYNGLSETWLDENTTDSAVAINGYNLVRKDRRSRGGGEAFYVKSSIKFKVLDTPIFHNNIIKQLWISVKLQGKTVCLGALYRPPSNNLSESLECLDGVISEFLPEYGLVQIVSQPTRITDTSSTLIDILVFSNSVLSSGAEVIKMEGISDHHLDTNIAVMNINSDLCNISKYSEDHGLILNEAKTELLVFGSHRNHVINDPNFIITLNAQSLKPVNCCKNLGACDGCSVLLVGFADACQTSYGALVYLRINTGKGICTNLLYAKTKLSPMKVVSVPRLELMAKTSYRSKLNIENIIALSDSTITLSWLNAPPYRWTTFVANSVLQIQQLVPSSSWYHVNGKDNISDCLSRGLSPSSFLENKFWWSGPLWLQDKFSCWPIKSIGSEHYTTLEEKPIFMVGLNKEIDPFYLFVRRCSTWLKVLHSVAFVLRFLKLVPRGTFFLANDLLKSKIAIIKVVQAYHFASDIRKLETDSSCSTSLRPLRPFMHKGILRVGGRLVNSKFEPDAQHPILLPKRDPFVDLLIDYFHTTNLHTGPHLVLSLLRQKYWILSAQMNTMLTQIEALMNSRPLCVLSSDPAEPMALTPSHFLTLTPLKQLPADNLNLENVNKLDRFQMFDRMIQDYWKRWRVEYLNTLQVRQRWTTSNFPIKIGTVVLLAWPNTPPLHWPLGIITETFPGKDGQVRVVSVKTKTGNL